LQKSPTYVAIRRAAEKGVLSLLIYQLKFTKKMTNLNIQELSLQELESLQGAGRVASCIGAGIATVGYGLAWAAVAAGTFGAGAIFGLIAGPTAMGLAWAGCAGANLP
jgi:hypothetical protein